MNTNLQKTCRRTALLAAALAFPLAAAATPFSNGGFELPGVASGSQSSISDGTTSPPTGWIAGGTTTSYAMFYENNIYGVIGISGPNAIGFGGNGTTGATLSQTFDTMLGTSYTVNYFVTAQQGNGPQSLLIQALNGATILGASTGVIPPYNSGVESYHWFAGPSLTFVAAAASSTIRITDTSNGAAAGGTNWALDGITVAGAAGSPSPGVVPEPATYGLLLAGLAMLGVVGRRKSKR